MSIQPTEQQIRSQTLRERIITVATELFHEYGYEKVSMREIAAAAGVTTGAIYHHFEGKQDILKASFRQKLKADELKARYKETENPVDELRDFLCRQMVQVSLDDGVEITRYRMFSIVRFDRPSITEECIRVLVENGVERGVFTRELTVQQIVDFFCAVYRSSTYQYCVSDTPTDLGELISGRFEIALRAVLADRDRQIK